MAHIKFLPKAENTGGRAEEQGELYLQKCLVNPEKAESEGKFKIMLLDHSNEWQPKPLGYLEEADRSTALQAGRP